MNEWETHNPRAFTDIKVVPREYPDLSEVPMP